MPLGRRQRVATVGAAAVATALSLAACSSSSSSSTPASSGSGSATSSASSSSGAALSGTLNGSGSTLQPTFQEAAISGLQVGPVRHDGQLRCRRLGQGAHGPGLGGGQLRGLGLADPRRRDGELQGQDGALLPRRDRPDHGVVQSVRPQQAAAAVGAGHREHLPGQDHDAGTTRRSRRTTPVSPCPAPRSPSPSAPTPRAPPRTSPCSSSTATGSGWTLGSSSTIKWPSTARAGNGNGGVASIIKSTPGAIGYVDYSDAKASGLTFASIKNKAGNYVAPSVVVGLRRRGQGHRQAQPYVPRGLGAGRQRVPDHLLSHGSWSTRPSRTRTTRPCSRRTSATCSEPASKLLHSSGLRAAAVQPRPDGHRRSSARSECRY